MSEQLSEDSGIVSVVIELYFNEKNLPIIWPALDSALHE